MSKELSQGVKKPETDDTGDSFFPDLEEDIQFLNDHKHGGGTDGKRLAVTTQDVPTGSWVAESGGRFSQTITITDANSAFTVDGISMEFRLTSSGHIVYPTVEKVTATTYKIYTNDNSVGFTAIYTP